jgi:hypothetical protein
MKTRNVFAGAVVGALALGLWLGSMWKGLGWGGAGTGFGTSSQTETGTDSVTDEGVHVSAALSSGDSLAQEARPVESDFPTDMLTIAIYGNEYRMVDESAPKSGMVMTLPEISQRVRKMTGTPEGIRVRILKGKTAQEGARADLLKTLEESGVKQEEIQERAEFID